MAFPSGTRYFVVSILGCEQSTNMGVDVQLGVASYPLYSQMPMNNIIN